MIDDGDLHRRIIPVLVRELHPLGCNSLTRTQQYGRMSVPATTEPWRIEPARRRYAWGSRDALPALLGEAADGEPLAELWFGAHPAGSATVTIDGATVGLDAVLADGLPFMVKLIAAAEPLSIQVHPSAERARVRFAEEQAAGVPASEQRYQDANAKPEIVCALSEFDALIDFRPVDDIVVDLAAAGLTALADELRRDGLAAVVRTVLTADAAVTEAAIAALVDKGQVLATRLAALYPGDPGVLIGTFLNHIVLQPGEAAFLGAGTVHAYLGGLAVEVMSTSDNVLRAGLTSKLIDVDEFFAVARLEPGAPDVLHADASGAYPRRAPEFAVARYDGTGALGVTGPAVVVATSGAVEVGGYAVSSGAAVFVPASAKVGVTGAGQAYVASAGA
jgi:mannose-6-phosphate isomerase